MKNIKILFTITDLGKGGAERFLLDLITELDNYPTIEYRIASLFKSVQYEEFRNNDRIHFLNYKTFSLRGENKNEEYSQLLDSFQPDIIHSNRFLGEFITTYDIRSDIQYVCHGHDNMIQFQPFTVQTLFNKKRLLNYLEYRFLKKKKYFNILTYFIANSTHTFQYFKEVLPQKQNKNIKLIQLGFNFDLFFAEKEFKPISKVKIINVGSYQPKKNQVFLVDVAEALKTKGVDFEMNLIGHGSEYDLVKEKIAQKGLTQHVFQRGLQSNVQEWYQNSDIYVHSANYEPFGLVLLEAMAAGLPIVTLDGKGNRDIIENDKNGYLFKEENATLFADKIIEYTSDREKYKNLSTYAQEYAKQFDVSLKVKELVEFYESILD